MVLVAIAGGTSPTLGKAIVMAMLQTSNTPIILSRAKSDAASQPDRIFGAEVRYADYDSKDSLAAALQGVHTVISVLKVPGPGWVTAQLNLLAGAEAAGVRRFAPSEFELGPLGDGTVDILQLKLPVRDACRDARQRGIVETARFSTGAFMNYLGLGIAEERKPLLHGFEDEPMIWDAAKMTAELPVKTDGSHPRMTMTEIGDVGRFVAAACELEDGRWEEDMSMVGDTIGVDEVVRLIEDVRGRKMQWTTVGKEELDRRVASVEGIGSSRAEMVKKMNAQFELNALEERVGLSILEPVVNRLCPQVKPISAEVYLEQCWA